MTTAVSVGEMFTRTDRGLGWYVKASTSQITECLKLGEGQVERCEVNVRSDAGIATSTNILLKG